MIRVKAECLNLIGDALASVAFIRYLAEKHRTRAWISDGFNVSVRSLLDGYPFTFDHPTHECVTHTYEMPLSAMWSYCAANGWRWNMAQGWFAYSKEPVLELPITLSLKTEPCGFAPGIVISPFSRTNAPDNNKFWPHDRWLEVISGLRAKAYKGPIYVVGDKSADDVGPYLDHGVIPFLSKPLPKVLDLLRQSSLVLGLDNGIGHLCHFGGVDRHVMIYCACLPRMFAENPRGLHVRAAMPCDVTVRMVLDAALQKMAVSA